MQTLADLLPELSHTHLAQGHDDARISGIAFDARSVQPGNVYVYAPDLELDPAYLSIETALVRGATAFVSHLVPASLPESVAYVHVQDGRIALAEALYAWHGHPERALQNVGITGTNGKTTCTFLLRGLWEAAGFRTGVIGTTGNYIGEQYLETKFSTPESHLLCGLFSEMRDAGVSHCAMEATSHGMAFERVAAIPFAATLFTNLTQDHLDFHGTMQHYAEAKKRLFDRQPEDSIAVFNGDSPWASFMARDCPARVKLTFGRLPSHPYCIREEHFTLEETRFVMDFPDAPGIPFSMGFVGRFNVENAAGVLAVAHALGLPIPVLQEGLRTAKPAPGRMHIVPVPGCGTVLVDYAHTPDALEKALATCRRLLQEAQTGGQLWVVFGCGGDRDPIKRPMMGHAAVRGADQVVLTSDNPRTEDPERILDDIESGISQPDRRRVLRIADRRAAIHETLAASRPGDVVLIAGKGHEAVQIIGTEERPFSDLAEVEAFVRDREGDQP